MLILYTDGILEEDFNFSFAYSIECDINVCQSKIVFLKRDVKYY